MFFCSDIFVGLIFVFKGFFVETFLQSFFWKDFLSRDPSSNILQ